MSDFNAKIKVVAKALPTYLAILAASIPIVLSELVPLLPDHVGVQVAAIGAGVLAVVAAVISTISRLTPVLKSERGLLPTEPEPDAEPELIIIVGPNKYDVIP